MKLGLSETSVRRPLAARGGKNAMAVPAGLYSRRQWGNWRKLLLSSSFSGVTVLLTHLALAAVPFFLSPLSSPSLLLPLFLFSAPVMVAAMGLGRCLKRLVGIPSSAPATVLFHVLFILGVYLSLIRSAIWPMLSMIFYVECAMLLLGLKSIMSSDPGLVSCGDSCSGLDKCVYPKDNHDCEIDLSLTRIRYCKHCQACIRGLDHHCPAFGNCIGQKNHLLFMSLLVGFIIVESSYGIFSFLYFMEFILSERNSERNLSVIFVIGTMHFCVLQVIWQVLFLIWHFYCVFFNITTEEWINWKKYPEFHVQPAQGQSSLGLEFWNPYDKGIIDNIKEFISLV